MQNYAKSRSSDKLLLLCKKDYWKSSLGVNTMSELTSPQKPVWSKDSFTGSPSQPHDYISDVLFYTRGWSAPICLARVIFRELPWSLPSLQYICLAITFLTGKDHREEISRYKAFQLSNSVLWCWKEQDHKFSSPLCKLCSFTLHMIESGYLFRVLE